MQKRESSLREEDFLVKTQASYIFTSSVKYFGVRTTTGGCQYVCGKDYFLNSYLFGTFVSNSRSRTMF